MDDAFDVVTGGPGAKRVFALEASRSILFDGWPGQARP